MGSPTSSASGMGSPTSSASEEEMEDLDEEAVKGNDEAPEEKLNGCNPPVPASAGPSSVPAGNAQRNSLGFQPEGLLHHLFPQIYIGDERAEPTRRKGGTNP